MISIYPASTSNEPTDSTQINIPTVNKLPICGAETSDTE